MEPAIREHHVLLGRSRPLSGYLCRGVILGIAPEALVVDITHEVDKYNIRHGALMLWCAVPFLPEAPTSQSSIRRGASAEQLL